MAISPLMVELESQNLEEGEYVQLHGDEVSKECQIIEEMLQSPPDIEARSPPQHDT